MTIEQLRTVLLTLISYLAPSAFVVYTYAAVTLERLLLLKREEGMVFTKTDLAPLLQNMLAALFSLIERDTSPEKLAENAFLMRCIFAERMSLILGLMRVMTVSRDTLEPFLQVSTQHLLGILGEISKNPSNPRFNHYLFESLAALIRYSPPSLSLT